MRSNKSRHRPLFLEWILQNKAGHRGILNRVTDVDKNKGENWIELHLGSEHPFWGLALMYTIWPSALI